MSRPFAEFWPHYLRQHADKRTRTLHVFGTLAGTSIAAVGIARRSPRAILAGLLAGYGPAWLSHAFIEHNRPETFRAPVASLRADYLMVWHALRGTLDREVDAAFEPAAARPGDL